MSHNPGWNDQCDVVRVLDDSTIEIEIVKRIKVRILDFNASKDELKRLCLGLRCRVYIPEPMSLADTQGEGYIYTSNPDIEL